jgi:hypothetical protein
MTFAQRRNRLRTHFSERNPVVKRRITAHLPRLLFCHANDFRVMAVQQSVHLWVLPHTSTATCPIVSVILTVERHCKCSVHNVRRVRVSTAHSISACPWTSEWTLLCSRSQTALLTMRPSTHILYSHKPLSLIRAQSFEKKLLMWAHLRHSGPHICINGSYRRPITNKQTTPYKKRQLD